MSTTSSAITAGTWAADPTHSTFGFSVKHMGIATVRGQFTEFEGTLEVSDDLASAKVRGSAKAQSIDTREPQRDEHLRSAEFFDAANYPELTFESTAVEGLGGESFRIIGNLTMHGVTKEVVLRGELQGTDVDPWGNTRAALEITGELSRGDFGMKFNQALGSGNMLVADTVKIALDISAVKQA